MMSTPGVSLTIDEWSRLYDEVVLLQEQIRETTGSAPTRVFGAGNSIERRIEELEALFSEAIPVDPDGCDRGRLGVGSGATVRWEDGDEVAYCIVRSEDIDTRSGHISYRCPLGRALVGRRPGDRIRVVTPAGGSCVEIMLLWPAA